MCPSFRRKVYFLLKTDVYNYLPELDESNNVVACSGNVCDRAFGHRRNWPSNAVVAHRSALSANDFTWGVTIKVEQVQGGLGMVASSIRIHGAFPSIQCFVFVGALQVTNDLGLRVAN